MVRRRALSQREVDGLRATGMHWVADNLYLQIRDQGTRSWLYRYWVDDKPKVVGLKSARDVSLADARNQADRLRNQIRDGADPAGDRKAARLEKHQQHASAKAMPTFEECARIYIASHDASWKNEKHRKQWSSTLKSYVYPVFGNKPVNEVGIDWPPSSVLQIRSSSPAGISSGGSEFLHASCQAVRAGGRGRRCQYRL